MTTSLDLDAELAKVPPLTKTSMQQLGRANRKLNRDPKFQLECLRGYFISAVLLQLQRKKKGRAWLAKRANIPLEQLNRVIESCGDAPLSMRQMMDITLALGKRIELRLWNPKSRDYVS